MISSPKIQPGAILKSPDFQEELQRAQLATRSKPYRARSVDYMNADGVVSRKMRNGSVVASFLTQGSNAATDSLETLINYLTTNLDRILSDRDFMQKFEEMSMEAYTHDVDLARVLKSHGWVGSRYRSTEETPFDPQQLLQALSNLYLKNKVSNYTAHISNMFGLGDEQGADQILSFCPDSLLTILRSEVPHGPLKVESGAKSFTFRGACMLADISGFSKFSAAMCLKGVSGLDDLREATNGFLGHIVKLVYEYKGDVIAFAGDALICTFCDDTSDDESPSRPGDSPRAPGGGKLNGCFRALQCACVMRDFQTKHFSAHIGVSYGEMKIAFLGGLQDQWVYLLNGPCVSELASCINDAGPQQVVATSCCFEQALTVAKYLSEEEEMKAAAPTTQMRKLRGSTHLEAEDLGDREPIRAQCVVETGNLLIESMDRFKSNSSPGRRKMSSMMRKQASRLIHLGSSVSHHSLIEAAALFVPRPVLAAVYSEALEMIGELRQVTTMFLSLDSYSAEKHQDPATLQPFFLMAQGILFEAGGFLRQFLVDDKGCVFIAMWGMPSFTYANNCSRALFCAVCISMKAKELDHKCSIGITTGTVFCGSVGAPERRDYAGIGNEVNLAARLMSKAKGRVIIDNSTYQNLSPTTRTLLTPAEEMKLKGMEKPIVPFQYNSSTVPRVSAVDESGYSTILRKQVKAILSAEMDRIANASTASVADERKTHFTIILGMPGTGKTTAADYFRHGMRKRNIPCILIQARPGHEGVPYGVMRELFLELVGEDNFNSDEQQKEKITQLVDEAYPNDEDEIKIKARLCIEAILGCEWSDVFKSAAHHEDSGSDHGAVTPAAISSSHSNGENLRISSHSKSQVSLRRVLLSNRMDDYAQNGEGTPASPDSKGVLEEYSSVLTRPVGDLTFYRIIAVLLKNVRAAIIIEDAHFCDELSWNELHLLLIGSYINSVFLLTMRSNTNVKPPNGEASPERQGRRSVLISENEAAAAVAANQAAQQDLQESSVSRYGMKVQASPSYLSILGHENSTVVEMSGLNEVEVQDILKHTLKVDAISSDLVKLVLDVSSGNAFWCKAIAKFIKERGVKELEKATGEGDSRQHSLKQLILLRMEKLDVDQQLVLKHAAIIGDEFSEKMLRAVLPDKLKPALSEYMEVIAEHGFVLCIAEYPQVVFGFQNDLIQETLYELTPPRDAAHIHHAVAEFIEKEYAKNLRPFYPSLSHHFQKSQGNRASAFKYTVKAADQAISRGAFTDGLQFVEKAVSLAASKAEYRVLQLVISRALRDIGPSIGMRKISRSFVSKDGNQGHGRVSAYLQLKIHVEAHLEKLSKGTTAKPEEVGTGGLSNKNRLTIHKQPSARLTWQPSYVASKLNDEDDDDDDDETTAETKAKKLCCSVS